jgi:hypothetical protein
MQQRSSRSVSSLSRRVRDRGAWVFGSEAIRGVMTELRAAVDADLGPDGDDQLHPDTITVYRTARARRSDATA